MMTLNEQKLAVCEKLPGLVEVILPHEPEIGMGREDETLFYWKNGSRPSCPSGEIHWPTEGLQVCHEAEKLLDQEQRIIYALGVGVVTNETNYGIHATYEQRLEALCRVWFPEKWT